MNTQLQARLAVLRQEFQTGQGELAKLEQQRIYLHEMMLRIGGAIQVLEELLTEEQPPDQRNSDSDDAQPIIAANSHLTV